ncbi:amidohydrolase family protein [Natranaerobius trueperi]|nr:amidohydrolase family protein [Natranaerobius trueperi]
MARSYPNMPIIIPHFGAGYLQEVLHLAWSLPNIYVDSSGSNQWLDWMAYDLELKDIFNKSLKTLGPERMIFGTDSSWFPRGFSYHI